MIPAQIYHVLFALTWIVYAVLVLRAMKSVSQSGSLRLSVWVQMFMAGVVFSLSGEPIERRFNMLFSDLPVAFYVKYFGLIVWFMLYCQLIRNMIPREPIHRVIKAVFGLVTVIGVFSIPLMIDPPNYTQARDILIGVRDGLLVIPVAMVFIPGTRLMARREDILGMKAKHLAIMTAYSFYAVVALGNVLKVPLTLIQPEAVAHISAVFTPFLIPCAMAYVLLLVPYEWLTPLHVPQRLYQFRRLKRLERQVLILVHSDDKSESFSVRLLRVEALEIGRAHV